MYRRRNSIQSFLPDRRIPLREKAAVFAPSSATRKGGHTHFGWPGVMRQLSLTLMLAFFQLQVLPVQPSGNSDAVESLSRDCFAVLSQSGRFLTGPIGKDAEESSERRLTSVECAVSSVHHQAILNFLSGNHFSFPTQFPATHFISPGISHPRAPPTRL
jgi:hypothetical protein